MSRFGLLKILISDLRIGKNNPKRENDANTGIHLLHFLSQDATGGEGCKMILAVFQYHGRRKS
jgi:hypothetical protein